MKYFLYGLVFEFVVFVSGSGKVFPVYASVVNDRRTLENDTMDLVVGTMYKVKSRIPAGNKKSTLFL